MPVVSMLRIVNTSSSEEGPVDALQSHPDGLHHVKEPTSSPDSFLMKSAMSAADLSQYCFSYEIPKTTNLDVVLRQQRRSETIPISSSSSTCTRESDTLSDVEGGNPHNKSPSNAPQLDRAVSDRLNAKVSLRKTSRQGRSSQRWLMDNEKHLSVRLVTGCVPILKSGKVLLVSSNRKPEWILPKGGWERDEAIEESAVRETFEEAGVLGVLGPRLTDVQYETRKAKKRRLEQEEIMRKTLKTDADSSEKEEDKLLSPDNNNHAAPTEAVVASLPSVDCPSAPPISKENLSMIRGISAGIKPSDETASNASTLSATYSQVRMSLFPLYVSKVYEDWPESTRLRKAVDIDEAIELLDSRPEFKEALKEVKSRGLHLMFSGEQHEPNL